MGQCLSHLRCCSTLGGGLSNRVSDGNGPSRFGIVHWTKGCVDKFAVVTVARVLIRTLAKITELLWQTAPLNRV